MKSLTAYIETTLAGSGLCILDAREAYRRMPGLWPTAQDCSLRWNQHRERIEVLARERAAHVVPIKLKGRADAVLLAAHSLARLSERLGWLGIALDEIVKDQPATAPEMSDEDKARIAANMAKRNALLDEAMEKFVTLPERVRRWAKDVRGGIGERDVQDTIWREIRETFGQARVVGREAEWQAVIDQLPGDLVEVRIEQDAALVTIKPPGMTR